MSEPVFRHHLAPRRSMSPEERKRAHELLKEGLSIKRIGKALGIAWPYVQNVLCEDLQVDQLPRQGRRKEAP